MAAHIVQVGGSDDWNNDQMVFTELARIWIAHPDEQIIVRVSPFQYRDGPNYWASEWARNMRACGYNVRTIRGGELYWRHVIDSDQLLQFCRAFNECDRQAQRLARAAEVPITAPLWQAPRFAPPRRRVLAAY